jgi:hypothetical protein
MKQRMVDYFNLEQSGTPKEIGRLAHTHGTYRCTCGADRRALGLPASERRRLDAASEYRTQ